MVELPATGSGSGQMMGSGGDAAAVSDLVREKDLWERAAGRALELSLGAGYTFRHIGGDTPTPDGYLDLDGVEAVACEITRVTLEEEVRFQAELNRGATGPFVALRPGSGGWIAGLAPDTRLKGQSEQQFQNLIDVLNNDGIAAFEPEWYPTRADLQSACAELGVRSIHVMDRQKDFVYRHRHIDTRNTWLNPSPELVATETQERLDSPRIQAKAARLVARAGALPAHLVLIEGDALSDSVRFTLWGARATIKAPTSPLTLPNGVDTVWLIAIERFAMSYSTSQGWELFYVHESRV